VTALDRRSRPIVGVGISAFLVMGLMTIVSSVVFMELRSEDGAGLSQHHSPHDRGEH
jgi:hypothetical protein